MKDKIRVKICCISSVEEAKLAIVFGASAIGLVGKMPSGPGVIDDELIAEIASMTPPPIATFLLTSETRAEAIIEHYRRANTTTVQLVDRLEDRNYGLLRRELPNVKLVQAIHVVNDNDIQEAVEVSRLVDAILLDSGNPNLPVKELGGTGRTHDWELSKRIRKRAKVPIFLAGGLNALNVREAIENVRPFGIDICSGVRTNGKLDPQKLGELFSSLCGS